MFASRCHVDEIAPRMRMLFVVSHLIKLFALEATLLQLS